MRYHTLNNGMAHNYTAYYTQEEDFGSMFLSQSKFMQVFMLVFMADCLWCMCAAMWQALSSNFKT